ncbi:unnamed protein product, partial [Symbiodinium pilosum]
FSRMLSPMLAPRVRTVPGAEIQWDEFYEEGADAPARMQPVWQGVWDWLHQSDAEATQQVESKDLKAELSELLQGRGQDAADPLRVAAAWRLAMLCRGRQPEISKVLAALDQLVALKGRSVMHVVDVLGPEAVIPLVQTEGLRTSCDAVHGLGRCLDLSEGDESHAEAHAVLEEVLKDGKDPLLRVCAAEALGCHRQEDSAWPLQRSVTEDPVGAVRATALHSLLRLLTSGVLVEVAVLEALRKTALAVKPSDPDRYVRAYAAELCHRIDIVQQLLWELPGATTASLAKSIQEAYMPPLVRWCTCGDGWHA